MKLGTKARYAVMAMVDLARHGDAGPVSLAEIARRQEISLPYLEQLFAKLRRSGLVRSVRGPGGGYLLAHDRDDTRIFDIILAVDEPIEAVRCKLGEAAGCRGDRGRCLTSISARYRSAMSASGGCSGPAAQRSAAAT
jgi:Rrf2 family transcriptional regulator, iron-sulfur cluster assembly transcription factor